MGQMMVVTLREGIEMFLIVAIAAAYLRKTGRSGLLPAVGWGAVAAVLASIVLGVWLAETVVQPFWGGVLALVAAALVIGMVIYMLRAAKRLSAEIGQHLEAAASRAGAAAWFGVFFFTVLMITREGMEFAFVAAAIARQADNAAEILSGGFLGLIAAGLLAAAWMRYGHRIKLALFFQVTSIFLILFTLQLLLYAFHEFTEAGALPLDNAYWHLATEEWAEGTYADAISIALVLIPLAWLAYAASRGNGLPAAQKS
jgi:high-affinity iron transporter